MQWKCEACSRICASEELLPRCPECGGATHSYSRAELMKAEIRRHLKAMEEAVETTLYPDELYERFLLHLAAAMGAYGAAVWRLKQSGDATLAACTGAMEEPGCAAWDKHRELISMVLGPANHAVVSPGDPGNPTSLWLLMRKAHERSPLVIEVAQRPDMLAASIRGCSRFLEQAAAILARARCIPWV